MLTSWYAEVIQSYVQSYHKNCQSKKQTLVFSNLTQIRMCLLKQLKKDFVCNRGSQPMVRENLLVKKSK
jgi:hypothetical protein